MSLSDIFDPMVRAYFGSKGGSSGGSSNDNIVVNGGVLSVNGDILVGISEWYSGGSNPYFVCKLCDEPISLTRITEVYVDCWLWNRDWQTEEWLETVRNTPCELDTVVVENDGYDELWITDAATGEWSPYLFRVTADKAVVGDITVPKGLYWCSTIFYPTRIVVAPPSTD